MKLSCLLYLVYLLLCGCLEIPDASATTEKGIVKKVYTTSDSGFKFISYAVEYKGDEIIVGDALAKTNFNVGDEIQFLYHSVPLFHEEEKCYC